MKTAIHPETRVERVSKLVPQVEQVTVATRVSG